MDSKQKIFCRLYLSGIFQRKIFSLIRRQQNPKKVASSCQRPQVAKPLFPAMLDKKCQCDMRPPKFTYCQLRPISHFTLFQYISHLQSYILQKTFIKTYPQPETHIRRLFHRANALPSQSFSTFLTLSKNFFAARQIFFAFRPATQGATPSPCRASFLPCCLGRKASCYRDTFASFCAGGSVGMFTTPRPFRGQQR